MKGGNFLWLIFFGVGLLLLGGGGIGGGAAPFKTDVAGCLIVEESDDRAKLTTGQMDVLLGQSDGSVRKYCTDHKIDFRLLDKDNSAEMDADWLKVAFPIAKIKTPLPWIIAANARTGGSQTVTTTADALKILTPIGGK